MKRLILLIVILAIFLILANYFGSNFDIEAFVKQFGMFGMVVFALVYILGVVLMAPGSVLTVTGGFLFGPFLGTAINLVSATIGASLSFLLARYVVGDYARAKAGDRLDKIITGVEQEGFKFVLFTRLVPLFPFNMLNYGLGLTRINVLSYFWASFIGMLPGCFAYTYLGALGEAASRGDTELLITRSLGVLAAFAVLVGLGYVLKKRSKL